MAGDRLRGHVRAQARASQYCHGDSYRGRENPATLPGPGIRGSLLMGLTTFGVDSIWIN